MLEPLAELEVASESAAVRFRPHHVRSGGVQGFLVGSERLVPPAVPISAVLGKGECVGGDRIVLGLIERV